MRAFSTIHVLIKNTLSLLLGGAVSMVFSYLTIVYLARTLGPGCFGKLNFAMAVTIYFTLITDMGLPLFGARAIARAGDKVKEHMDKIISLRLCLAVVGFALLLLTASLLNKPTDVKHLIMLYGLGLIPSALLLEWVFQGIERMEYIGLSRVLSRGASFFLIFIFVKGTDQLLLVPCLQILGNVLTVVFLLIILSKRYGRPRLSFNLAGWREILRQAAPLGAAILMIQVIYNIDTIMLGFMRSDEEVGYYNAGYKIIFLIFALGLAFFDSSFPVISRYYEKSLDSLRKLQYHAAKLVCIVALPLTIGGALLAGPIIESIYGQSYNQSIIVLQVLLWSVVLWGLSNVYARGLIACDRQNRFLAVLVVQTVTNLVLNIFLIPSHGVLGASIATVAAELVGLILYKREFDKIIRVPFSGHLVKPTIASLPMVLFLYWGLAMMDLNVLLVTIGGAAVFLVSLALLRGVSKEEIAIIKSYYRGR